MIHFLEIAYGSLTETFCQLDIAHDLRYISNTDYTIETERINVIGKLLSVCIPLSNAVWKNPLTDIR